jgi:hypothetical protein
MTALTSAPLLTSVGLDLQGNSTAEGGLVKHKIQVGYGCSPRETGSDVDSSEGDEVVDDELSSDSETGSRSWPLRD